MPRQYGFDDNDGTRLRESEIPPVRQAVSRRIAGTNKADIAKWMNAQGYRGTRGAEWVSMTVGRLLRTPAIAGLEEGPDGELTETGKPAIITPEEFLALRALDEKEASAPKQDAYDYAFTGGLGVCGLDQDPLTAARSNSDAPGYRSTCGKVRIDAELLESHVGEYVLAELLLPGTQAALEAARQELAVEADAAKARIKELKAAAGQLASDYLDKKVSRATLHEVERQTKAETKKLQARVRFLEQAIAAPRIDDVDKAISWWEDAPGKSKRGITSLLLTKIEVFPASAKGIRTVEPGRVVLHWRSKGKQSSTAC
ncbi:recombinase family protein [Kitasatospora sp. MBT63]|uniref:recombinase family protein n=1 Tax=Kitasatospora sp. MBT63 TaxID=1444768 RepID=UPI00053B1A4A|nr:recombinase family protein [Kitasatospora sp. MBT63]